MERASAMQQEVDKYGITKGKLLLVGFLAFVLFVVIFVQLNPSESGTLSQNEDRVQSEGSSKSKRRQTLVTESNEDKSVVLKKKQVTAVTTKWRPAQIDDAISHNPFQVARLWQQEFDQVRNEKATGKLTAEDLARQRQIRKAALAMENQKRKQEAIQKEILRQKAIYQSKVAEREEKLKKRLHELQRDGFDMVFANEKIRMVRLGNRKLKPGDTFEDIRVVAIRNDGSVLLEEAYSPGRFVPDLSQFKDSPSCLGPLFDR